MTFAYKIDGHLRHSSTRDIKEIAWIFMFADNIALITEDEAQMQHALQLVDTTFSEWGLELSMSKTKAMPLLEAMQSDLNSIKLVRGSVEFVSQFKYLGSMSATGASMQPEIANRLAKAGGAFHKMIKLWGDKHLSRQLCVYKAVVQATLLYGCESWAMPQSVLASLDTFQMSCLRRICGISLRERKTNQYISFVQTREH